MGLSLAIGVALALLTAVPLAWKWQLGIFRTCLVVAVLGAISGVAVTAAGSVVPLGATVSAALIWLLTIAAACSLLAYRFYRDPDRTPPRRSDAIVSPADGAVVYVRRSRAGALPVSDKQGRAYTLTELTRTPLEADDAIVIGIGMNFADVHVNRAPIEGRVVCRRHFHGLFGSLRNPEMVFENERATTVIEGQGFQVAVVQIASRLVRQIVLYVREGQGIALGQRLGAIRFGSQVDLVLPVRPGLRITTQVGERLRAGESVVGVLEQPRTPIAHVASGGSSQSEGALVIGEHVRGLALVRSLGRRGIRVWTLEPPGQAMASRSRYSRRTLPWPEGGERERLDYLFGLAARHQLEGWALFPASDETTALCSRHHAALSAVFRMTVPPWESMAWAYDKRLTHRRASEVGVAHPKTFCVATSEELFRLPCAFPVVLKPAYKREENRFTRDRAWRANDRAALIARFEEACTCVAPDVVMFQELIPGDGRTQFSYAALCVDGHPIASLTARRTRQYPVEFGHSSSFVETVAQPAVEHAARRLLEGSRYTGLVEVEFKYDVRDRRFKLLDVNPRVWTWHAIGRRAGVDFPYLLWRTIHGARIPEVRGCSGVRWVRMSTDALAACTALVRGELSLSTYLRSLAPPIELATFAFDDPLPGVLSVPHAVSSRLKQIFGAAGDPVPAPIERSLQKPA